MPKPIKDSNQVDEIDTTWTDILVINPKLKLINVFAIFENTHATNRAHFRLTATWEEGGVEISKPLAHKKRVSPNDEAIPLKGKEPTPDAWVAQAKANAGTISAQCIMMTYD